MRTPPRMYSSPTADTGLGSIAPLGSIAQLGSIAPLSVPSTGLGSIAPLSVRQSPRTISSSPTGLGGFAPLGSFAPIGGAESSDLDTYLASRPKSTALFDAILANDCAQIITLIGDLLVLPEEEWYEDMLIAAVRASNHNLVRLARALGARDLSEAIDQAIAVKNHHMVRELVRLGAYVDADRIRRAYYTGGEGLAKALSG